MKSTPGLCQTRKASSVQKVERLPYFSFYVADYLLDTGDLSYAEHGAYCLMMFRYYWSGALDPADKYRGARSSEDRVAVDVVSKRFFHDENGKLVHNRIERELVKISAFVEHQSKAGKASAAARADKKPSKPRGNGAIFTPPDWVIVAKWDAWVKIRPAKARTPEALAAAIEKLEKMRAAGHDANAIIAESLANGWQGLFAPDSKRSGRQGVAEHNRAAAAEAVRRMSDKPPEKIINET